MTRVGVGYDSHRFAPGGPLILGGVAIPSDVYLTGHSDADAVAHAVTDAILGAAALGDIGAMFPDNDPANAGRNSLTMLADAVELLAGSGFTIVNVDVTVIAERPRIAEHRIAMRDNLASVLRVQPSCVSVKGKTNEGMGWIGHGEGIACVAVATVSGAGS